MNLTSEVEKKGMSLILKAGKKKNRENHLETPIGEKEEDPNSP